MPKIYFKYKSASTPPRNGFIWESIWLSFSTICVKTQCILNTTELNAVDNMNV